ncbi:MAG: T9SS type A sorting domain-containing protein [Chitinophagales bacterium]
MTYLYLEGNQLSGNIPNFSNLQTVTNMYLSNNQLSGELPDFSNLSNIAYLYFHTNQLTGDLPDFGNLPNLGKLFFHNNQLSGNIPDFTNLVDLYKLHIQENQLTFAGLENNVANLNLVCTYQPCFRYAPQANIPIYQNGNTLYVEAGGTLSNNTYTWFKDGVEIATITADSTFTAVETGTYYCMVSNSIVTNPDDELQNLVLQSDEIAITETTATSVWPGDADNDGTVTVYDVLNIGLAYDATGIARPNATMNWQAEPCEDWNESFSDGLNYKYADCNGDAIINSNDVDVVDSNFGQTHNSGSPTLDANGIALNLSQNLFLAPTPENNQTFTLDISADANLYGLAYTLDYVDATVCEFKNIDFSGSCLGTEGIDFVRVVKNDAANHKLYIGISRLNKVNANCGSIAKITMEILDLPADNNLFISIENGIASSADETLSPIPNNSINVLINGDPNCATPSILDDQNLTASSVTLSWNNTNAEAYQLAGRKVGGTAKVFPETTQTSRTFTSGLQPSTCYEWSVRAKCDGVWTDWYMPLASFCTGAAKNGQVYSEANDPFLTNEKASISNVVLYPNPAKETVFLAIESDFETSVEINIFDILGKKVKMQKNNLQIGNNELKLNVDALETGIYFIAISNGFESTVQKLQIF